MYVCHADVHEGNQNHLALAAGDSDSVGISRMWEFPDLAFRLLCLD
jgi:hypothetical protein